jgi:hypothetical protein
MKKNFNITFNQEDSNLNDYLSSWVELSDRPNKTSIFHTFDKSILESIFSDFPQKNSVVNTEIYPSENYHLENQKHFIKLDDGIFLSYTIFDVTSEEGFVGDIVIFYDSNSKESVESIIQKLEDSFLEKMEEEINDDSLFTLTLDNTGFNLVPINYLEADYDNIDLYYNTDVLKNVKKLSKKINSNNKGLSIIWGKRGSGKSTLCCDLLQNIEKKKIYISQTILETAISSVEFRNFVMNNKNLIFVIDDVENLFSDFLLKSNSVVKNLIQLVDGLDSDNFMINLILIVNTDSVEDIDENFLECNNLLDIIEVDSLSIEKANELSKKLKKNKKYKKEQKLVDVLKKKNHPKSDNGIGYE